MQFSEETPVVITRKEDDSSWTAIAYFSHGMAIKSCPCLSKERAIANLKIALNTEQESLPNL